MISDFERIQQSYEKQCEDIMNYVEMIDNLRSVVYKNIRELGGASTFPPTNEQSQTTSSAPVRYDRMHHTEPIGNDHQQFDGDEDNVDNANKNFMNKIRGTTKKTIQHAEEGLNKLDGVLKQLRTNMHKK
jgi:archaellum component FlaC